MEDWKARIPLSKVMEGKGVVDGRVISAAQKAAQRMLTDNAEGPKKLEGQLLNNYNKLVAAAESLRADSIVALTPTERNAAVKTMVHENATFPQDVMEKLLRIRLLELEKSQQHGSLFEIITPWGCGEEQAEFDPLNPTLSNLPLPMKDKILLLHNSVNEKLIAPLIAQGTEETLGQVQKLVEKSLATYEDVDYASLDGGSAALIPECLDVWKTLFAVVTTTADPQYLDSPAFSLLRKCFLNFVCSSMPD